MKEQKIQGQILKAISCPGQTTVFRNNTGTGWQGQRFKTEDGDVLLKSPRPLRAGLCEGSSDIIGWHKVTITPQMVGETVAVFVALEVKTAGKKTTAQQDLFLRKVRESGGIGARVTSIDEAKLALKCKNTYV